MNTTAIITFTITTVLTAIALPADTTNRVSPSAMHSSAYVLADEWQPPPQAAPPQVNNYEERRMSDWNLARNSVRLTNLMAHAGLIVEGRAINYVATKDFNCPDVYQPEVREYDLLTKVRIERIIASCWPEAETRQHLVCSTNAAYLYLAGYTRGFTGMNVPVLLTDDHCLLWLVPLTLTDDHYARVLSSSSEPISRSAIYEAYLGWKGSLLLNDRIVLLRDLIPAGAMPDDQVAEWDRRTIASRQEYLMNSFNTTNKNDILQAVRYLAHAMSSNASVKDNIQKAKQHLNGAADLSLDALTGTKPFQWVDVQIPMK